MEQISAHLALGARSVCGQVTRRHVVGVHVEHCRSRPLALHLAALWSPLLQVSARPSL